MASLFDFFHRSVIYFFLYKMNCDELLSSKLNRQSFELTHIQMMEESLRIQQLSVCTLFDNLAVLDDDDVICIANRGQAMSNDKTGSTFHQTQQCFLDARFGACVHAGGGFVEDENARVG